MKVTIYLSLFLSLIFLTCCSANKQEEDENHVPDYSISFGKVSRQSVFVSDTMSIWGGSLIHGEDGKYHLLYSQWPKRLGWVWVSHSEIAHAISDSPFGPFEFKDLALPARGAEYWDGLTSHNPSIYKFGDKYYLYYMGNTGDGKVMGSPGNHQLNWSHRNNQRIGVAVADSPNGPWERSDQPVLDISPEENAHDALMVSNPSVCQMPDGKILMVYKAVAKQEKLPGGGPVVHMVAIADSPTGPFKKYPDPIFTIEGERFPAEDPFIWYQDGKYRAIVKRMKSENGKNESSLVHYDSFDGIHWDKAKNFLISDRTITWEDGTSQQFTHLERPQVFMENGQPIALLCAADTLDSNNVLHSFNIQIPLNIKKE